MATSDSQFGPIHATKITYINGKPQTLYLRKINFVIEPMSATPRQMEFDQNIITLGSMDDNDIVILSDETISRHHCRIVQEGDSYVILDLQSTNGTYVNGVRVKEAYLSPGVIFRLGNTNVRFNPIDEEVALAPSSEERLGKIVGKSLKMREIFDIIEKIAPTSATVVIEGETGTGKEVVSQTLHSMSKRKDKPFIVFDCGAVPENLIESELFGHEKGSFTGAITSRKGLFEMAEGGTIFLDELGELSIDLQPKLLRVLEQREVRRVGSNKPIAVDVRVIAATNRKLEDEVKAGRFREDLFYRLSVVRLMLPALKDRSEDIEILVKHFLESSEYNRDENDKIRCTGILPDALQALVSYSWPGNIRELNNVIERACSFADDTLIGLEDLPDYVLAGGAPSSPSHSLSSEDAWSDIPPKSYFQDQPFKQAKEEWVSTFERDYIAELIARHNGNISQAAREADIDRKYFRKLMQKYEISPEEVP